ncbi:MULTISPECIES: metallophosphoesterase [unclassified Duganella]|uniref:metallophosphoesterase family protein n=1 Tax=unclassified Duganella TaxID=2636909 RepID=UPI0006FFF631|nr:MULTISPECIES: metallophosphoesterase family protein [unclassified Duganella]KQV54479.1 metallophosphoesterase [Duganella sp. Root336D2]KRC03604.1 metallophosphoesterase [Duganella sp. Root198D2]
MRIAVMSDIHGNLWALDAVLADIARRNVEVTVNLGDILSGPLLPAETAERLMALGLPTIRGNHERQVLEHDPARMGASDLWAHEHIGPAHRAWIASLPGAMRLHDDVLMVHGTPGSDLVYWMESVDPEGQRTASYGEVLERAGDAQASLILCGHTHVPRSVLLDDGRLIVNPGSVGLQAYGDDLPYPHKAENGSPHARYAIVERTASGWALEQYAVAYDWHAAAEVAQRHGRPEWAFALRTGRMG